MKCYLCNEEVFEPFIVVGDGVAHQECQDDAINESRGDLTE